MSEPPYGLVPDYYPGFPITPAHIAIALYVVMFLLFFLRMRREVPVSQALYRSLAGAAVACLLVAILDSIVVYGSQGEVWIVAVGMACFSALAAIVIRLFSVRTRNDYHG